MAIYHLLNLTNWDDPPSSLQHWCSLPGICWHYMTKFVVFLASNNRCDWGPKNRWKNHTPRHSTVFFRSPIFCGNGAPASHWWLRLGSNGLPQDKASSQTCHNFLATVQMGRRDVGTNPYQHLLTWGKIHEAARILTQGKTAASAIGVNHAFQDSPLHNNSAHTL